MHRSIANAFALASAIAFCLISIQSNAESATVSAEVIAAEVALSKALGSEDWAEVKVLMTPDHVLITPYLPGETDVEAITQAVTSEDFSAHLIGDRQVVELGDGVALLKQDVAYQGKLNGVPLPEKVHAVAIWQKIDGAWKQSYYQETAVFEAAN
ncbi:MAG: nuclear transport factor 2 family protein [Pseudomonadota bacterium]